jgi:hypothetical protein
MPGQKRYSSGLGSGHFGCSDVKGGAGVASFQPADYKLVDSQNNVKHFLNSDR